MLSPGGQGLDTAPTSRASLPCPLSAVASSWVWSCVCLAKQQIITCRRQATPFRISSAGLVLEMLITFLFVSLVVLFASIKYQCSLKMCLNFSNKKDFNQLSICSKMELANQTGMICFLIKNFVFTIGKFIYLFIAFQIKHGYSEKNKKMRSLDMNHQKKLLS